MVIKVVLTNVVKSVLACVHELIVYVGYVSYQCHAGVQMSANIFCGLGGSTSLARDPVV